jgi:hypothetical protein
MSNVEQTVSCEVGIYILNSDSTEFGLESRKYGRKDPSRWPRGTLYSQKLALTSPTSGGRSVGIFRSRTQATEFSFSLIEWNETRLLAEDSYNV